MLRRLLTLLVALPLLLPQGVCVCDFMQTCEACEDCANATELARPTCSCCRHQREAVIQDDAPAIAKSHTCHKSDSSDKKNDHLPGCPAKEGSACWKGDTAQPLMAVTLVYVGMLDSLDTPAATSALSASPIHLSTADPPIYLTTLSLRI